MMTAREEAAFEAKAAREFRGQRELPNGRDFMWNYYHRETKSQRQKFRENFDKIKWNTKNRSKTILKAADKK